MAIFYPQAMMTLKVRLEDFQRDSNSLEFYELNVLAKTVTVNVNSYFEADTFTAQIEYKNFPFDPRIIRAISVSIHAENMKGLFDEGGKRKKIRPSSDNVIFLGFVDDESIKFDDGSRMVTLEGRDYTSLFVDEPYLKGTVPTTQTVDAAIQTIISELPSTSKIRVVNKVESTLPVLSSFYSSKDEGNSTKNVRKDQSYWDVIQQIINEAGLIGYIELDTFVISKPRILFNKENAKVFLYGHSLKSLSFKRKLGRRKNFNVAVRAINLEKKEVMIAKIPEEATDSWLQRNGYLKKPVLMPRVDTDGKPLTDADLKPAPYITFSYTNITNKDQLIAIGEELFEEVARQEIEGSFSTKEMTIYYRKPNSDGLPTAKGQIQTFDVLTLRSGTPVAVVLKDEDIAVISKQKSREKRIIYLQSIGYPANVAAIFADSIGKYSSVFYTKAYRVNIDSNDGISFDVDFINYLDIDEKLAGSIR